MDLRLKDRYKQRLAKNSMPASSHKKENELETIRGAVQYRIVPRGFLESDKLIWVVMDIKDVATKEHIKVVGETNHYNVGDYLEFYGTWVERNGKKEFHFKYALRVDDDYVGATAMLAFLFGAKTAKRIIEHYDNKPQEPMNIFKNNEERFREDMKSVKGIGDKKIQKAYEKHKKYIAVDALYFKYARFNLSLSKALKLIKKWGSAAADIIDENVYQLIHIDGFSFETIDRIGLGYYKFDKKDGRRIEAYLIQILKNAASGKGDCFLPLEGQEGLIAQAQLGLNISDNLIREKVIDLIYKQKLYKRLYEGNIVIYLPHIYKAEKTVVQIVSSAIHKNKVIKEDKVDMIIADYEKRKGFTLANKQKESIKTSCINQFSIISGPPGSGKTTIVDVICEVFRRHKKTCNIKLAALAGKAATRMAETTGIEASTIHRLLGYNPDTGWTYNEKNQLPNVDLLIIDEFSMVDILLFEKLMKAVSRDTVVICVGDKDQLPSVDCGQVLEDLIDVPYIPKTILEEIYRQKKDSTILKRALAFNKEQIPSLTEAKDFKFISCEVNDIKKTSETVLDLYVNKIKQWGIKNVCLMVPQNVKELGGDIMNLQLQGIINPPDKSKTEISSGHKRVFREGDRVIQLKNIENGISNGMVGTVIECFPTDRHIASEDKFTVLFDNGNEKTYAREDFDMLKLAYALTIHKSQGSEYKCIIMLMDEHQRFMIRKKLVYTGMTRCKDELFIVGQEKMFEHALKNKDKRRNTMLTHLFMEYKEGATIS